MVTLSPRYLAIRRFTISGEAKNRRFGDVSNYLVVDDSVVLQRVLRGVGVVSGIVTSDAPGEETHHQDTADAPRRSNKKSKRFLL